MADELTALLLSCTLTRGTDPSSSTLLSGPSSPSSRPTA